MLRLMSYAGTSLKASAAKTGISGYEAMKLRYKGLCARGIYIYLLYASGDSWYERRMFKSTFFSNAEVHRRATLLFNCRPRGDWVRIMAVSCYALEPSNMNQVSML